MVAEVSTSGSKPKCQRSEEPSGSKTIRPSTDKSKLLQSLDLATTPRHKEQLKMQNPRNNKQGMTNRLRKKSKRYDTRILRSYHHSLETILEEDEPSTGSDTDEESWSISSYDTRSSPASDTDSDVEIIEVRPAPEPEVIEFLDDEWEPEKFEVEKIIGHRINFGLNRPMAIEFEVEWTGYENTTWEPVDILKVDCPASVREYWNALNHEGSNDHQQIKLHMVELFEEWPIVIMN